MAHQDDSDEPSYTEVAARPIAVSRHATPERSPDAIFRSFVANAYEDATPIAEPIAGPLPDPDLRAPARHPVPSVNASLRGAWLHDDWASSVEELLDEIEQAQEEAEPTTVAGVPVPARPVVSLAEEDDRRDTEPPPPERPTPREPLTRASVRASLAAPPTPTSTPATPSRARTEALVPGAEEGTLRVVLLTRKKPGHEAPLDDAAIDQGAVRVRDDGPLPHVESPSWESVVKPPSTTTQRREALKLVPDVAHIEPPSAPPAEGSEDGMMPGGELDRKLSDMAVLLRYGHEPQVRRELDHLTAEYPRDLLLLRRISEFWVGNQRHLHACDALFTLASGLFERRNVEGMRQALEQVLVLSPGNERASRLLSLLAERPSGPPG